MCWWRWKHARWLISQVKAWRGKGKFYESARGGKRNINHFQTFRSLWCKVIVWKLKRHLHWPTCVLIKTSAFQIYHHFFCFVYSVFSCFCFFITIYNFVFFDHCRKGLNVQERSGNHVKYDLSPFFKKTATPLPPHDFLVL